MQVFMSEVLGVDLRDMEALQRVPRQALVRTLAVTVSALSKILYHCETVRLDLTALMRH